MELLDLKLLAIVYFYVIIIFLISEKILKDYPSFSRKFVHIMVGNCIFIMPFFNNPMTMVWFLTLPITIIAFLMSKYSPISIKSNVTEAGHDLGLVYYAGIWTILIFLLPDKLWLVALAIATMVYGDGFASVIGQRFGKHEYGINEEIKSFEGSFSMFISTFIAANFIFYFYHLINYSTPACSIYIIATICFIVTVVEAISPKGLDNITTPSLTAILYYAILVI